MTTSVAASAIDIRAAGNIVEARQRHAETGRVLRQSDIGLAGLGFSVDQIAAIRNSGELPLSFWR